MPRKLDPGFEKATDDNLPLVDEFMLACFFRGPSFANPETRSVKVLRSADAVYSDNAIGWVQVRDTNELCEVRAQITPEHRVTSSSYSIHCIIDEKEELIKEAKCDGCRAQNDGCKHAVAFVSWLYRKAQEPSVTSVQCYWKKSTLSAVGTRNQYSFISNTKEQRKVQVPVAKDSPKKCFNEVCEYFKKKKETKNILVVKLREMKYSLSIHHLMMMFKSLVDESDRSSDKFLSFCSSIMTDATCRSLSRQTLNQAGSRLWFDLRYARITASKIYEASRCKTADGSLVKAVLGIVKVKETEAIKRGRDLEKEVLKEVRKTYCKRIKKSGFVMNKMYPIFGASPDGIMDEWVIEVKCPISDRTFSTYFEDNENVPAKKHKGQMALQMFMCDKNKGLFCVAHPDFENSRKVKIIEVFQDQSFLDNVMKNAQKFWCDNVYPFLHDNM